MDIQKQRACILSELKKRNSKEHSFKELIKYSNKLLASLDYLQETMFRKIQTSELNSAESLLHSEVTKAEESPLATKCNNLEEELKHCHVKISEFAQQIIDLKNTVEEKGDLLAKKTLELDRIQNELKRCKELNETYQKQLSNLKAILQDKIDEFDALNITFSSVENKKNDLEIEIKKLKDELYLLKSLDKSSNSSESSRSASITSALLSAANDISVGSAAKPSCSGRKDITTHKVASRQYISASIPSKLKFDFVAHDSEVNAVLWLPQMLYFVTAGHDRKVKLWEMCESGVELRENIRGCNSSILSVDIDPEANLLLCASSDFASRVWTMCDFTIRHTLTGHSGKVTSSKFMNETNRIISGSSDQTLKMWDLRQRVCIMTCNTSSPVNDVASRPSNFVISGHSDRRIRAWDLRMGNEVSNVTCTKTVTSLDISKNGYFLLASERSNCLKIFDMRMFKEINSLQASNFEIDCDLTRAKFSPDSKYCCCGSKQGSVFIWNVSSQAVEKELKGHTSSVASCCWSSCGSYLLSCDKNRRCFIWN